MWGLPFLRVYHLEDHGQVQVYSLQSYLLCPAVCPAESDLHQLLSGSLGQPHEVFLLGIVSDKPEVTRLTNWVEDFLINR